jgi:hypothetical protein
MAGIAAELRARMRLFRCSDGHPRRTSNSLVSRQIPPRRREILVSGATTGLRKTLGNCSKQSRLLIGIPFREGSPNPATGLSLVTLLIFQLHFSTLGIPLRQLQFLSAA